MGDGERGGSWNNPQDNARCANRNDNHPDDRNDNLGFRCCSKSPRFDGSGGPSPRKCRLFTESRPRDAGDSSRSPGRKPRPKNAAPRPGW